MLVHPPLTRILPTNRYHWRQSFYGRYYTELEKISFSLSFHLSIFLSLLNVSSRSSPIMILENRIRLIEIQLRCQTLFNSPGNKSGKGRMNSGASLFAAWRRLLRNYATVINPATISDVNRPLPWFATTNYKRYITNHLRYWILCVIRNTSWEECLIDEKRNVIRIRIQTVNIRSATIE